MNAVAPRCLACSAVIPLDDINVAKDVALCRACGRTSPFSELQATGELRQVDLTQMPRNLREVHDAQSDLVLIYRRWHPMLFFLIPFTALWSGLSVGMIYLWPLLQGKALHVGEALFGLPFLAGTCILLGFIAYVLLGRWEIRLRAGDGTVFTGIGPFGWTRRFTLDRSSVISLADCGAKVDEVAVPCIRIVTGTQTLAFGAFLKDESKRYLAARLQQETRKR